MRLLKCEIVRIRAEDDLLLVRQALRDEALALHFEQLDQIRLVIAATELGRNALIHGGGGSMQLETVEQGGRQGVRLVFDDQGPGIPDIELAMSDEYTTTGGLGHGLGAAKRLMDEFAIESRVGQGTKVTVLQWK